MIVTTAPDGTAVRYGESLQDVLAYIAATPRIWHEDGGSENYAGGRSGGYDWDFGLGWQGTLELCRTGWSAGAIDLHNRLSAVLPRNARDAKWRYDVAGELPDVGRYVSGEPAHMRRRGKSHGHRPVVHLVVNAAMLAAITSDQQKNFGTALLAAIDAMEQAGCSVELDRVAVAEPHIAGTRSFAGWKVKRAGDHCDLAAIAFALAHPAAHRRITFALRERGPKIVGYGKSDAITEADAAAIGCDGALLINGIACNKDRCKTMDDAVKFVAEQINTAAGETLVEVQQCTT